jgi:tetratricopeptide (TPR) repeat protein
LRIGVPGTKPIIFVLSLLLWAGAAFGNVPADSLVRSGMDLLVKEDYPAARNEFQKVIELDPDQPCGYFFQAVSLQLEMLDYETHDREKEFYAATDNAVKMSRKALARNPYDAWANFYLGASFFYRAAYEGKRERYWTSLQSGIKGLSALRAAVAYDSTLYDAYMGLGSYDYFRSKATRVLSMLPFVGDNREKGIAEIRLAMERGEFTPILAKNGLVWILLEEKRYDEAETLAAELRASYPGSRTFRWAPAEIAFRKKEWEKVVALSQDLLQSVLDGKPRNYYNEAMIRQRIALAENSLGRYAESQKECETVLGLAYDPGTRSRLHDVLAGVRELQEKNRKMSASR